MKAFLLIAFGLAAHVVNAQGSLTLPPSGDNQRSMVVQWIGPVEVSILYSSPDVHGPNGEDRRGHIWGELVPYGFVDQGFGTSKAAPWRAGANENTIITFSYPVKVEGKDLPAGSYGLFLAAAREGAWTWIFSKNSTSWGSYFYHDSEDALRVDVMPVEGAYSEFLTYGFDNRKPASATAYLQWESRKIPFKIEVADINEVYLATIRKQLRSAPGFDYRNWSTAAQFCAQNNVNLQEGLTWADKAMDPLIGGVTDFTTLSSKASVLMALGRDADAEEVMDKAVRHPSASVISIHQYGRTLLNTGKKETAMGIFQYNAKAHPEETFTTFVGLARGYSALGNKKEAIKNWEIAIRNVPENQKGNLPVWEGELRKLKEGI